MKIIDIVKKLYPFNYSISGEGNDRAIREFLKFHPFKIHSFSSGKSLNGWKIPHSWKLKKGLIKNKNEIIYDAKKKYFGVPNLSKSFRGYVSYNELKKRIFFSDKLPNSIPYNWTNLYRSNSLDWGFCIPKNEFKKLRNNKYLIDIHTKIKKSKMKVLEYTLKGKSDETIIVNAHNCHPYQANDDISGCAVGISIFQMLKKIKNRKFTYTLLIAPELIGPIFWLKKFSKKKLKKLRYSILLKSVGNKNIIKLQHSVKGNTEIDNLALKALKFCKKKFKTGKFRTIYGNDEIVFNSPGYNIHTISLTRVPFPEYHTDSDTPEILSEKKLTETFKIVKKILLDLEKNIRFKNNFSGVISLSNPKYELYLKAEAPGIDKKKYSKIKKKWNLLMNNLPFCFNKHMSVHDIASYHGLPYKSVLAYCNKWEKKKLITRY